ncbi:MAG: S8 family peptidase [Bryobacterales bacterium]|nr:S8 family peptidase [Bryobacterales bacterium]
MDPDVTVDVIVRFKQNPQERHREKLRRNNGRERHRLDLIRASAVTLTGKAIKELESDPDVAQISPDHEVSAFLDYGAPAVSAATARQQYGVTGKGIGVAVIDSGVYPHKDLLNPATGKTRIVYNENFVVAAGKTVADPKAYKDDFGHGSHVAGIIAANGTNSTGPKFKSSVTGIAPGANIINLKVLDLNGKGTVSGVIAAIQRAIQLKNQYNIRVINLSLGHPVMESFATDPLCQAAEAAYRAGITVVTAAGNLGRDNSAGTQGYATITSPGNDPFVITVGSMKTNSTRTPGDDAIASYSSKGPTLLDHVVKPDLVAPGNRIVSLLDVDGNKTYLRPSNVVTTDYYAVTTKTGEFSKLYYTVSGTSMASGFVSGAVALMLEKDPTLTPDLVKARLMKTATKSFPASSTSIDPVTREVFVSQHDLFTVGAGYLNVAAAVASTDTFPGAGKTALSPLAVYDDASGDVFLVQDYSALWGTNALWGTSAVWGTNALWGTSAVWGTSVLMEAQSALWGSNALWGTSAVWGNNATQGFSALWGSNALWGSGANSSSISSEATHIAQDGDSEPVRQN